MEKVTPLSDNRSYIKMALVIEDNADMRRLLEFYLKDAGFYPLLYTNAEEVLTILRSLMMEIVIIDLMLPGMNGVEFVREIEQRKRRNAPILVISALEQGRLHAQAINAEGYLQKPFSLEAFVHLVNKLVEEHAALQHYEALL